MSNRLAAILVVIASAERFEDGRFAIDDTTLEVNRGGTVDLRVRLGEKPRSDVTVALTETSALISLGSASLTFTPDNWDQFQDVTVTAAAGNRQTMTIGAPTETTEMSPTLRALWSPPAAPRLIDPAFIEGGGVAYLRQFQLGNSVGFLNLFRTHTVDGTDGSSVGPQMTSNWETSTHAITLMAGGESFSILGPNAPSGIELSDDQEAYTWEPSDQTPSTNFLTAYFALLADQRAATSMVLRDYAPGSAIISLAASGPAEYAGKTATATVTVN